MTPARFEIGQKHKQESEAGSKASWNTPRSDSRPTMSYPSRMALAFALTSLTVSYTHLTLPTKRIV